MEKVIQYLLAWGFQPLKHSHTCLTQNPIQTLRVKRTNMCSNEVQTCVIDKYSGYLFALCHNNGFRLLITTGFCVVSHLLPVTLCTSGNMLKCQVKWNTYDVVNKLYVAVIKKWPSMQFVIMQECIRSCKYMIFLYTLI